jgi:hypothetical protein
MDKKYILDIRGGCLAIYQPPMRNCLSYPKGAFVFYQRGKYSLDTYWNIPKYRITEAKMVYFLLNNDCMLLQSLGKVYAFLHMLFV